MYKIKFDINKLIVLSLTVHLKNREHYNVICYNSIINNQKRSVHKQY